MAGKPITPDDFNYEDKAKTKIADEPTEAEMRKGGPTSPDKYEGDIDMSYSEVIWRNKTNGKSTRNAIKNNYGKWPGGVIPYVISPSFNSYERGVIAKAMKEYHLHTCIRFVPRVGQTDYIKIMKGTGCHSKVGRCGRKQDVSLGTGCVYTGIVIHELMHAVGFWHEQSRFVLYAIETIKDRS